MSAPLDHRLLAGAQPVLVTFTGPVAGDLTRVELDREMTIAEAIAAHDVVFRLPTVAVMSGLGREPEPVLRGAWHLRMVRKGEILSLIAMPRGGNNGKRIVGVIAALALAVAAPFAGGAIAGALGLGAQGANIASAAFLAGGSLLLNALIRPTQQQASSTTEQVYLANASSNRAMPLEPIPCPYGLVRYPPPYASRPYSEFSGNDQYLYQLHCWGVGSSTIERWEIGDTLAWTSSGGFTSAFKDIQIAVYQPGEAVKLFPANVTVSDNVSGQTIPNPPLTVLGPYTVNPAGTEIEEIAVDFVFPGGLYRSLKDGTSGGAARHVVAEYRRIDDSGNPLGGWSAFVNKVYALKTRTPQRFTERGGVAAGRYQVRVWAVNADTSEDETPEPFVNRAQWVGLRGYLKDFVTPPGVTLIATKIRASEQVSAAASGQYIFTGRRRLPIYNPDTGTWSAPVATRNPAWAVADMLRNGEYGLGLADDKFDLPWLAAYADLWADREDWFDGVFDRRWVAMEAINAGLEVGRAQLVRLGGRIGFVRDEPKAIRRHVFTPRNIVRDSIEREDIWFDEGAPDHVKARFINRETWTEETVDCVISSVGAADAQEIEQFGIVDRDHAWREGIYRAAENAYRRSFRSFTVEAEGRLLVRGDPIALHDPLARGDLSQIAALVAFDVSPSTPALTVDRDLEEVEADAFFVVVRDKTGREWGPCLVDAIDGRTILLDPTNRFVIEAQHGALADLLPGDRAEPAHVSILADDTRLWAGLVVSATPNGRLFDIVCVNDDQRVHAADETEVIPSPWTPPNLFNPVPEAPSITGLAAEARRGLLSVELEAGWQPAAGAQRYVAEISYDENAESNPEAAGWTPVHDSVGTRFVKAILPQPVTLRVAAVGIRQGPWTYKYLTSVPALDVPPESVGPAQLMLAVKALLAAHGAYVNDAMARMEQLALAQTEAAGAVVKSDGVFRRYKNATAAAMLEMNAEITEIDGELTATADLLAQTRAGVNQFWAGGLFRTYAVAGGDGAEAGVGISVAAGSEEETETASLIIEAKTGGGSRVIVDADGFFVLAGTERKLLIAVDEDTGALLLPNVLIGDSNLTNFKVNQIASEYDDDALPRSIPGSGGGSPFAVVGSFDVENPLGSPQFLWWRGTLFASSSNTGTVHAMRFGLRNATTGDTIFSTDQISGTGTLGILTQVLSGFAVDGFPAEGTNTYEVLMGYGWTGPGTPNNVRITGFDLGRQHSLY